MGDLYGRDLTESDIKLIQEALGKINTVAYFIEGSRIVRRYVDSVRLSFQRIPSPVVEYGFLVKVQEASEITPLKTEVKWSLFSEFYFDKQDIIRNIG